MKWYNRKQVISFVNALFWGYQIYASLCEMIFILPHEPWHDKNQQSDCAPSEDSDQPGHPPSLIRVFAVRMKKALVLSYPLSAQRRLWSDWADAQADLSLRWAHSHFAGFVLSRLILKYIDLHENSVSICLLFLTNIMFYAQNWHLQISGILCACNTHENVTFCENSSRFPFLLTFCLVKYQTWLNPY